MKNLVGAMQRIMAVRQKALFGVLVALALATPASAAAASMTLSDGKSVAAIVYDAADGAPIAKGGPAGGPDLQSAKADRYRAARRQMGEAMAAPSSPRPGTLGSPSW
jgi:hypothetical protein